MNLSESQHNLGTLTYDAMHAVELLMGRFVLVVWGFLQSTCILRAYPIVFVKRFANMVTIRF